GGGTSVVPSGHLRDQSGVAVQPQDPALCDLPAEPLQARPGGPQRPAHPRRVAHLRQRGRPGEERHQHEVSPPGGRTLRHLQRPHGQLGGRRRGGRDPAGPRPAGFLLPAPPLQTLGQEEEQEVSESVRGVSAQHQGGGVHGQVYGEELQQQTLHGEEHQHPQPQPGRQRQGKGER
ncbi:unnamed protein product%2C partial, partial [Scomber scombrus]